MIIGIEADAEKVQAAHQTLASTGLYGARIIVEQGTDEKHPYADYFANLVVSFPIEDRPKDEMHRSGVAFRDEIVRVTKPCGGVALLLYHSGDDVWIERKMARGPLEGAGKWTHQYADPGNTACSDDQVVKGPLGTLWFGDPGPERMVERHARPVAPVAMDGRLFVQGEDVVMAYDAYNGVKLWEKDIPGAVRVRVDSDMGNLALATDGLYVATNDTCLRLDPATGETLRTYALPGNPAAGTKRWGYIACTGDTLFGTVAPPLSEPYAYRWEASVSPDGTWRNVDQAAAGVLDPDDLAELEAYKKAHPVPDDRAFWEAQQIGFMWRSMSPWPAWGSVQSPVGAVTERIMASDVLFALNPENGEQRWVYQGKAIAHPAIAIGDGLVFLADCNVTPEQKQAAMDERRAFIEKGIWEKETLEYRPEDADVRLVVALDAATGAKRWERIMDLTGCGGDRMGLAYYDGVLCFYGCFSNHDRSMFKLGQLKWRRITAVNGKDGADLWSKPLNYLRRPVVMTDTILIEPRGCDLHTGAIKTRLHPLTGAESTWEFARLGHCCSITSACPNMFFLRGYILWYYDMNKDQGMQAYGAIRPGCWINTIPANGLVMFPEASAGCGCSYPIRSTVVLEPKPEQRVWATCVQNGDMTPVNHIAINFGAPADWRADDGTLWFSYPHPPRTDWYDYGINFGLDEQTLTPKAFYCRNYQGLDIKNTDKPWIFGSGCNGLTKCTVPLLKEGQGPGVYTVRLFFAEPGEAAPGQRVFNVKLQGETVLRNFDIATEAGAPNAAVVKEFKAIKVDTGLNVELEPKDKAPGPNAAPIINGMEIIREDVKLAKAE